MIKILDWVLIVAAFLEAAMSVVGMVLMFRESQIGIGLYSAALSIFWILVLGWMVRKKIRA